VSSRRATISQAALQVIATSGLRGLTHREVDRVAGVPAGSTGNLFSTRESLLAAVVEELERLDATSLFESEGEYPPPTLDAAVGVLGEFAATTTRGELGATTRARLSLLLAHPEIVAAAHERALVLLRGLVAPLDLPDPAAAARRLAAYLDGLALHGATGSDLDPDEVRVALRALLLAG